MRTKIYMMALSAMAVLGSCSDNWDEHYGTGSDSEAVTLYEMIKADPQLSTFGQMIDVAEMKEMLSTTQTYTVWAPVNEALVGIDLDNKAEVVRTVSNHIARFNVPSALSGTDGVRMYNGKVLYFDGNNFGGVPMASTDSRATNGILHRLSSRIPYSYNIREYIDTHSSCSKLAAFIARFDEQRFDEEASRPIDVDENGATIYDSVLVSYNRLFEHPVLGLGDILSEGVAAHTMLVPDNEAWDRAYSEISPHYTIYNADKAKADSIREVQTSLAIIDNLIFKGRVSNPSSGLSLTTTTGNIITDPSGMFAGAERIEASNGMIFLSKSIGYNPDETYNPLIEVEAENPSGRVRGAGTTIYTRVVPTDNVYASEISDVAYIEVSASSVSRQPGVTFDIPDTRSGKYDIYATFVPAAIDDNTHSNDSTRLRFVLSYRDASGKNIEKAFADKTFLTSGTRMTTIKVAEGFELPVSNYYDRLWLMDEANDEASKECTTRLYIVTNVNNTEFNRNELTRRFRVDRVFLVPSQK